MPNINDFMKGFGFIHNNFYYGYRLIRISGEHKNIGNHHYEYFFELTFDISRANITVREFFELLTFQDKIIDSSHGNAYMCHLNKKTFIINENNTISFFLIGNSHRV